MVTKIIHGVVGFIVLGSMTLATMFLYQHYMPRQRVILELSPDDILEQLAQARNYSIECDTPDDCRLAFLPASKKSYKN